MRYVDWTSASGYRYAETAEPAGFAWEFLRRNPDYLLTFESSRAQPDGPTSQRIRRWGLRFPADPSRRADEEGVFWHPDEFKSIIPLQPAPPEWDAASTSLATWPSDAVYRYADDGMHIIVRHGNTTHQLWLIDPPREPSPMVAIIPLDATAPQRASAASCFWRTICPTRPRKPRHRVSSGKRLVAALRALDGHLAGASYRAVAETLFGPDRDASHPWKTAPVRDRVIRLTRSGLDLMRGGYRKLLKSCPPE
jgi:hypothetical protein